MPTKPTKPLQPQQLIETPSQPDQPVSPAPSTPFDNADTAWGLSLKPTPKPPIPMRRLNVGPLRAMGYDIPRRALLLELTGGTYEYGNISPEFWRRLNEASSPLSFYRDNIEDEIPARRIK